MPTITIPLAGANTQRGSNTGATFIAGKDQRFIGCYNDVISSKITRTSNPYLSKRVGLKDSGTLNSGKNGGMCSSLTMVGSFDNVETYQESATTSSVFSGSSTSLGTTDANLIISHITSGLMVVNNVSVGTYLMPCSYINVNGTGGAYHLPYYQTSVQTFTGDRTSGSAVIPNIVVSGSDANALFVGQLVSGTGFIAGTRISSIDSTTQITLTNTASSGSSTGTTFTRENIAKIINSTFTGTIAPTIRGRMEEMDGYFFIAGTKTPYAGVIFNSAVNNIQSWSASNYISASKESDTLLTIAKLNGLIYGFGPRSIETFYNAGNSSGSILSSTGQIYKNVGIGGKTSTANVNFSEVITSIGDYLAFVSNSGGVWIISKDGLKKISNPAIEGIGFGPSPTVIDGFYFMGRPFLHVAAGTTASVTYSFFYDIENDDWKETGFGSLVRLSGTNLTDQTIAVMVWATNGKYFTLNFNSPAYQDNGSAYTMTIQTEPYYLNDGEPFIIDEITLEADTQSSGSSTLTTSGDDYATFGTVGSFDLTQQQKNLSCGGYYDSHVIFKLTDAGNNAWRGQGLKVKWRPYA